MADLGRRGGAGLALTVLAGVLLRWSERPGWGPRHRLAVAGAALVLYAVLAFAAEPLGDVQPGAKYAHNAVLAIGVVTLLCLARLRLGTTPVKGPHGVVSTAERDAEPQR